MQYPLALVLAGIYFCCGYADINKASDFEFSNNRGSFSGTLTSSDSWQLEAGYHYMFCRFVGVGVYLNVGPCGIGAGYMMSNHDVYCTVSTNKSESPFFPIAQKSGSEGDDHGDHHFILEMQNIYIQPFEERLVFFYLIFAGVKGYR